MGREKGGFEKIEKELQSKQRVVERLHKDLDDKTDSIRLAASEVMDLKRKIDKLKRENA